MLCAARAVYQFNIGSSSSRFILLYSRPMLGAGSSSGLNSSRSSWVQGCGRMGQVFHSLFIPTFPHGLSILVVSPFLHKGFASSSPCPAAIYRCLRFWRLLMELFLLPFKSSYKTVLACYRKHIIATWTN